MIPVAEMLERLQNADKHLLDNNSEVKTFDPKWIQAKKILWSIPSELKTAINFVEKMPEIQKSNYSREAGTRTNYTRQIYGYEFIFEIINSKKNGTIRAWLTLYDNENSICALRDLLEVDPVNKV